MIETIDPYPKTCCRFSVAFSEAEHQGLGQTATNLKVSRNKVVRHAVLQLLDRLEKQEGQNNASR